MIEKHQGALKHIKENDIRRLIIKLLILGVLEEHFIQLKGKFGGGVAVYIELGKNAGKIEKGKIKVFLSNGVDNKNKEFEFEEKE